MTTEDTGFVKIESLKTRVELVRVSPEVAAHVKTNCYFPNQRILRTGDVKKWARAMSEGKWMPGSNIHVAEWEGKSIFLNGYHRFTAQCETGKTQDYTATFYTCQSWEEVKAIYQTIDTAIVRTPIIISKSLGNAADIGVSQTMYTKATAATGMIANSWAGYGYPMTPSELFSLADEWKAEIREWNELAGDSTTSKKVSIAPVMSIGLVTLRYSHDCAADFWGRVARNNALVPDTPEHTLNNYIQAKDRRVASVGPAIYARAVAAAWNAHHRGASLKVLRPQSGPIVIAGTPFKG